MPHPLGQGLVRPEPTEVGGVRVESRRQRVHDAERAGHPQNVLERRTLAVLQALTVVTARPAPSATSAAVRPRNLRHVLRCSPTWRRERWTAAGVVRVIPTTS